MGTNYLAPTWRMPQNTNKDKLSNYSLELDGATEYINFPTTNFLNNEQASFSFWIKPYTYSASNYGYFFSGSSSAAGGIAYSEGSDSAPYYPGVLYWWNGSFTTILDVVATENVWNHFVVVFNGTSLKTYKNGSLGTTKTITAATTLAFDTIGKYTPTNTHYVKGDLSQFCVFDYALSDGTGGTEDQISYLYNLNNPMVISGAEPIAYWPLGDNSNPTALAGYPNVSVGADSVFNFNGTNNYISIQQPSDFALGTIDFTISAWVFATGVPDNNGWIYSQGTNLAFGFNSSGTLRIWVAGVGGFLESTSNFSFNTWQNVVVVRSSGVVTFYINTSPSGSGNRNGSISAASYSIIGMFNSPNQNPFQGELSNFQLWETALTTAEISTLYNNGQPLMTGAQPQAANLKHWYKLNQHDSYWDLGGNGKWTFNNAAIN